MRRVRTTARFKRVPSVESKSREPEATAAALILAPFLSAIGRGMVEYIQRTASVEKEMPEENEDDSCIFNSKEALVEWSVSYLEDETLTWDKCYLFGVSLAEYIMELPWFRFGVDVSEGFDELFTEKNYQVLLETISSNMMKKIASGDDSAEPLIRSFQAKLAARGDIRSFDQVKEFIKEAFTFPGGRDELH